MPGLIRRHLAAFIAGVSLVVVALGGGAAYAYWTVSANASGSIATTKVEVTTPDFAGAVTKTYINSTLDTVGTGSTTLSSTAPFSVVYTAGTAGTLTVNITAPSTSFTQAFTVRVWGVASAAACTSATPVPSSGVVTLTNWSGQITSTTTTSATGTNWYCMRSTAPRTAVASAAGAQSANVAVNASLASNGWTSTSSAQGTQATAAIYPLSNSLSVLSTYRLSAQAASGNCLDISGSGTTAGALVISYQCTGNPNQKFRVSAASLLSIFDTSLVTLNPQHTPTSRLRVGAGTADNVQMLQSVAGGAAYSNSWFVQRIGGSQYQFVSAHSGRCLSILPTSSGDDVTTVECTDASANITVTAVAP